MSDDDFMMDSEEEDYEFEFESDGSGEGDADEAAEAENVSYDNQYYSAKAYKAEEPQKALTQFRAIIDTASDAEWRLKALKQSMKLYNQLGAHDQLLQTYREFLDVSKQVNRNQAEQSLNKIIAFYGRNPSQEFLTKFYDLTLASLSENGTITNERLWTKINLGNAQLLTDAGDFNAATKLLDSVTAVLAASTLSSSSTYPLEVIAGKIQIHSAASNFGELRKLHKQASKLSYSASTLSNPLIMATLSECAGKTLSLYKKYDKAAEHFFTAFKNYDEIGHAQRGAVLRYLIITTLLSPKGSEINPFQSNEVRPFAVLSQFRAWAELAACYQACDAQRFNAVFPELERSADPFMLLILPELAEKIRELVVINLLSVFETCKLAYLAGHLAISLSQIESIVVRLINNGKLSGVKLDLVQGIVVRSWLPIIGSVSAPDVLFNCKLLQAMKKRKEFVVPSAKLYSIHGTSDHSTVLARLGGWLGTVSKAIPRKIEGELGHAEQVKMEQARGESEGVSEKATAVFAISTEDNDEAELEGFAQLCQETSLLIGSLRVANLEETLTGRAR